MKSKRLFSIILLFLLLLVGCTDQQQTFEQSREIFTVGVNSDFNRDVWRGVGERLKKQNIDLEIKMFSDYVQPDIAVDEGAVDAVTYQYSPFLLDTIMNHDLAVVPIGYAQITPLGIWAPKSKPLNQLADVPTGGIVAIGNDPVNMDHQLRTFADLNMITLASGEHKLYTIDDITENPHRLTFKPIDTASMMSYVDDVDLFINGASVAGTANYELDEALFIEDPKTVPDDFKLVFAVSESEKNIPLVQKVRAEYQTEATAKAMARVTNGKFVPGWDPNNLDADNQRAYDHFQELKKNYHK